MDKNENIFIETKLVWSRRGNDIKRKYRCTLGYRKNRIVSTPSQCFSNIDMKKRFTMKKTLSQKGSRMNKKANRTKRFSPKSKLLRSLNK